VCARGAWAALLGGRSTSPLADMAYSGIKRSSFLGAIGASVAFAVYNGWLSSLHMAPSVQLYTAHRFVLTALFATWLVADAQEGQRARPTFDHGGFALFLFGVYAPIYLISTRRGRGLLVFVGMAFLFVLPGLVEDIGSHVS
jgi:hypothetical protein